MNKLPITARELVDELLKFVPEVNPEPHHTMSELQRHAGKRELVLYLQRIRDNPIPKKGSSNVHR